MGKTRGEVQKRTGETTITSVSVSKQLQRLVDKYSLSPTEVYRRGVAVSLYDMGVEQYNTPMNRARSEATKENEELQMLREKIKEMREIINNIALGETL